MRRNVLSIFLLFLVPMLFAQGLGNVAGKITRKADGQAMSDVAIFIAENQKGTYSTDNGTFYIRDIEPGTYTLHASYMGYKKMIKEIEIIADETATVNFQLEMQAVEIEGFKVTANRAVARETPVAFTDVNEEEIKDKYTTGDMPQMLEDIPGLFSTTSGLGEAEITMRGFDANKIQILVNGVPVNDPESQVVYWSNWTGLSSNVKSVQVQRGSGASLYGSGAFGGSVNIETMGTEDTSQFTVRTSGGYYSTDGESATSDGEMEDYTPINYNMLLKYTSGNKFGEKFKFNVTAERKAGDYYIRGTEYDGWSFGFETESKLKNHVLNSSFIFAPQKHNQARSTYDRELGKILGREFNFTNHKWQENKYQKPQFSVRDRWSISPQSTLMTNLFVTQGKGYGAYANNIIFDAETGGLYFKPLQSVEDDLELLGKYAYFVYKETNGEHQIDGLEIIQNPGYETAEFTMDGESSGTIYSGSNTLKDNVDHSWKMESHNEHNQFGLNTYFDHDFNDNINVILGAEARYWVAHHYKEGTQFRYNDPSDPGNVTTFDKFMRDYDYDSSVLNTSGFARTKINIPFDSGIQDINLMLDAQYAIYTSEVSENMIKLYDFVEEEFLDYGFYASKNDTLSDGSLKFDDDDYQRTFEFLSPKMGININLTDHVNVLSNYSIAYKEPRVADWYDRDEGPGVNQIVDNKEFDLDPEKAATIEGGLGYRDDVIKTDVNYYYTKYSDKIESITDNHEDTKTINVGEATHQGIEFSFTGKYNNFDFNSSATFSRNRWDNLSDSLSIIFYEKKEDVEDKVVPFSPEKMASIGIGYTFQEMPLYGKLRIGLNAKWNDEYYTTYDNVYCKQLYYYDEEGNFQSIGEHEFVENADGTGHYDYNEETEEYVVNFHDEGSFDREWILRSSKLPAFFELNGSLKYDFLVGNNEASIKLNVNNILNKEDNFSKAYIGRAYGMQYKDENGNWTDPTFGEGASSGNNEGGGFYPYLSPSPLLNVFLTVEYKF